MPAPANQPDLELLRRFQVGDAAAFGEIVSRYSAMVFTACLRVTHDKHRAEDLTQETFFKLSQRPHEVTRSLGAWLHRVATRLSIDALRRTQTRRKHERGAAQHAEQARHAADTDEPTWARIGPLLDSALADLPEASRDIIVRHYLMQQSQRQIAAQTGMSQPTVSRRLAVALDQLRRRLAKSGVTAGVAALGGMLAAAPAHAAPAGVGGAAGGMSLLTQVTGISQPVSWAPLLTKVGLVLVPVGGLAVGAVLIVSGLASAIDNASAPTRADSQERLITEDNNLEGETAPEDNTAPVNLVFTIPDRHAYRTTYISGATVPSAANGGEAQLVYADGHVVSLPRDQAIAAIEAQTGTTFDQVRRHAAASSGDQH